MRNSQLTLFSVGTGMMAGNQFTATIRFLNNGSLPWRKSELYRLGSQNPQDNQTWGFHRVEMPVDEVAPGEEVTFTFEMTAPSPPGYYDFAWRMVDDGQAWFGELAQKQVYVRPDFVMGPLPQDPNEVKTIRLFDTGPFETTGGSRNIEWRNDTGHDLKIYGAYLWIGGAWKAIFDTHLEMFRESDFSSIHRLQWDHYKDPPLPLHGTDRSFIPKYKWLRNGDALILHSYASLDFEGKPSITTHHRGDITFGI